LLSQLLSTYLEKNAAKQPITTNIDAVEISDSQAIPLVGDLILALDAVKQRNNLPLAIRESLQEIQNELQKPTKAASAKLKITLPIIPMLVSYELELNTESFLAQTWGKVTSLFNTPHP